MITQASFLQTKETNPYKNLALEEHLLLHCREEECILYLWQNRHTVVIGRNQNCWKECNVNLLEQEDGFLVRRLSGGGAVYHDLGNLNFTFLVRKENYDVARQMQCIVRAMEILGIHAEISGRNDATVDGRKFSGNAFYETGGFCYHHGTLLMRVDTGKMARYLNVSNDKLQSKGVTSVKSRVANLCEFRPDITIPMLSCAMKQAFKETYQLPVLPLQSGRLDPEALLLRQQHFSSWDWKYGRTIPFQQEFRHRFSWGDIQLQLEVNEGRICQANVFTDSMDPNWASVFSNALTGLPYHPDSLCAASEHLPSEIRADLTAFFRKAFL